MKICKVFLHTPKGFPKNDQYFNINLFVSKLQQKLLSRMIHILELILLQLLGLEGNLSASKFKRILRTSELSRVCLKHFTIFLKRKS